MAVRWRKETALPPTQQSLIEPTDHLSCDASAAEPYELQVGETMEVSREVRSYKP